MRKIICIVLLLVCACSAGAATHIPDSMMHSDGLYVDNMKMYSDSAIFQGAILKMDFFNTCYFLAVSTAKLQTYNLALSLRLRQRFYPTLELGYLHGDLGVNDAIWHGQGGWTAMGLDFNGMRKNLNALEAILVGVRLSTAVQKYDLINMAVDDTYWQEQPSIDFTNQLRNDWWGELVAGCQVHVFSGLMMGWDLRLKLLFTRKSAENMPRPYFVPGYGYWKNTQWGFNYYIGWKF